jgi:hypothetical protein
MKRQGRHGAPDDAPRLIAASEAQAFSMQI